MSQAHFKLRKYPHYAEVVTSTMEGETDEVIVSPNVFSWLKDVYGPDAWEWPVCDDYRDAAKRGVRIALNDSSHSHSVVTIESIHGHPCHTTNDAVVYAAAFATADALGFQMRNPPIIKHDSIVLPCDR